jgi:hypothetical protein
VGGSSHCDALAKVDVEECRVIARSTYVRRQPEGTVLHQVVRGHLETFLAEARLRGGGEGLPRFVERELREFLTCGVLAEGFARFRCTDCQREILVAFSCKERGFCPSCRGRRLAELAAHGVPPAGDGSGQWRGLWCGCS